MTANTQANGAASTVFEPWMEFWSTCIAKSQEHTAALLEAMQAAPDLGAVRRRWLDALSQNLDTFLRSPAFLEAMRRNFEAMTEAKSHGEEAAQRFSREAGIPRLSDVSGLFERLRLAQEAILDRLATIERRLETIESSVQRPLNKRNGG